ncbi:hypothetical protein ACQY0O_006275 [Thecaphora frezii]
MLALRNVTFLAVFVVALSSLLSVHAQVDMSTVSAEGRAAAKVKRGGMWGSGTTANQDQPMRLGSGINTVGEAPSSATSSLGAETTAVTASSEQNSLSKQGEANAATSLALPASAQLALPVGVVASFLVSAIA